MLELVEQYPMSFEKEIICQETNLKVSVIMVPFLLIEKVSN